MAKALTSVTLEFEHERDTKNKAVFSEVMPEGKDFKVDAVVGKLYFAHTVHESMGKPEKITLVVTAG